MNNTELWNIFLNQISTELNNKLMFDTWFSETSLISISDGVSIVRVPNPVHIRYLENIYSDTMIEIFNKTFNINTSFRFICEEEDLDVINKIHDDDKDPLDMMKNIHQTNLRKEYTFDSYIVGNSNKIAQNIAVAVAQSPGTQFNPFFIYGKSGLGKTHLMHAVGNYIDQNSPYKVIYITAQTFLEEFVDSLNLGNQVVKDFKEKYRNIDVLIVDDIQFFAKADKTQEEFFHIFDILHQKNKQIIISSDRSPRDLSILEERLRTRFDWGISVEINPPDFKLRKDILVANLKTNQMESLIDEEVIEYIASKANQDVRELEGTLRRLLATAAFLKSDSHINMELALECLADANTIKSSNKNDVNRIIKTVAQTYNVEIDEIISNSRKKEIIFPRQVAMYISRNITDLSFQKIGLYFGNKNHSTVINSCNKIQKLINTDQHFSQLIFSIKEKL